MCSITGCKGKHILYPSPTSSGCRLSRSSSPLALRTRDSSSSQHRNQPVDLPNNDIPTMVNAASSSDGSTSSSIGFDFDNATRNAYLSANPMRGFGLPKATSTGEQAMSTPLNSLPCVCAQPLLCAPGTTIVGCIYAGDPNNPQDKGGVVLGADTRATEGSIVADKNCEKVCPYFIFEALLVLLLLIILDCLVPPLACLLTTPARAFHYRLHHEHRKTCNTIQCQSTQLSRNLEHVDPLHFRQYNVLRCRNSSRYGIHNCRDQISDCASSVEYR
jgi:hypothetical protein